MNKNYKPINYSFREYYHIHGRFSPEMIEELLGLVDDKGAEITKLTETIDELEDDVRHFSNEINDLKCELRELT